VLDRNALPQIAAECQIGTNTSDDAYCGDWSPSHQDRKLPLVVAGWVSESWLAHFSATRGSRRVAVKTAHATPISWRATRTHPWPT